MNVDSLVSIIIPCYNPGKYLLEAVDSVVCQDYPDYEIIIVDDGSTDIETREILELLKTKEKVKVLYQENAGPGVARNRAVENAFGSFLVFLDADDLIRKQTITKAFDIFQKHPNVGVVYGDVQKFQNSCELIKQTEFNHGIMFAFNQITILSVIRKSVFIEVGGFDVDNLVEDYDFWLSVAETTWEFHYVDEIFFDYRILNNSRTNMSDNERKNSLMKIYKKHAFALHVEYMKLYHENKNFKSTLDYKLGYNLLKPLRCVKKLFFTINSKINSINL